MVGLGRVIALSGAALGAGLILFSFSRSIYFSLPLLTMIGFSMVVEVASCNTVLQTIVHDDKRGRVMALFTMAFLGVSPLGSLLAGAIATLASAQVTLAIAGAVCLVSAAVFAGQLRHIRPLIRPIYETKGILPQLAAGIEQSQLSSPPID